MNFLKQERATLDAVPPPVLATWRAQCLRSQSHVANRLIYQPFTTCVSAE
jgi:hypothetical protein